MLGTVQAKTMVVLLPSEASWAHFAPFLSLFAPGLAPTSVLAPLLPREQQMQLRALAFM